MELLFGAAMWVFLLLPTETPASVGLPSSIYTKPSRKAFIRTTSSNSKKLLADKGGKLPLNHHLLSCALQTE